MDEFQQKEVSDPKFYKVWVDRINKMDPLMNSQKVIMLSGTPMLDDPYEIDVLCNLLQKHTKIDSDMTKLSKSNIRDSIHQLNESISCIILPEKVDYNTEEHNSRSENKQD